MQLACGWQALFKSLSAHWNKSWSQKHVLYMSWHTKKQSFRLYCDQFAYSFMYIQSNWGPTFTANSTWRIVIAKTYLIFQLDKSRMLDMWSCCQYIEKSHAPASTSTTQAWFDEQVSKWIKELFRANVEIKPSTSLQDLQPPAQIPVISCGREPCLKQSFFLLCLHPWPPLLQLP